MVAVPKVKGLAFRSSLQIFSELKGEAARERALESMGSELGDKFRYGQILASGWYSIDWYARMLRAFRDATGAGLELPKEIGRESIRRDMQGVHKRVLLRMLSPELLYGLGQRLFGQYYDTGSVDVVESRSGYVRGKYTGCVGFDENLWTEIVGTTETLLELAGAKHIRLRLLAGGGSQDHAELEARWTR